MKALITFGCSWTKGIGSWYDNDIPFDEFDNIKLAIHNRDDDEDFCHSFRKILSKRHGYENVNFATGGSANNRQIRFAEEYFNADDYKKYDEVIVLWGITSTARLELWEISKEKYSNFFFTSKKYEVGKIILKEHYDHDVEVKRLSTQIKHWDNYFEMIGVKNYWFDTFNHHDYEYNSSNMIMGSEMNRDLMSRLCKDQGFLFDKDDYHHSNWRRDSDRIKFLLTNNLVNPYSLHPNKKASLMLADILDKHILW